jgi:diguanylate cyclase (GGDEF)-like protein
VVALDPRSLIFIAMLLALICVVILFALRRSFPSSIEGIDTWAWSTLVAVGCAVLFGLRGAIPDLFSIVLANGLLIGSVLGMTRALQRLGQRQVPPAWKFAPALAGVMAALAWFTYVRPDYPLRLMFVTAILAVLFVRMAVLAWRVGKRSFAATLTAAACGFTAAIFALRCATVALGVDEVQGLFDKGAFQALYLAAFNVMILVATLGFTLMANERLRETLEYLASHDALSGALARRAFLELAEAELARSLRHGHALSLLMVDLDNFKAINDRYGHLVGDRVIADFARRVRDILRLPDSLGRYGGEEFAVLLPETRLEEARVVAERIRGGLAGDDDLPLYTVSIGVALAYPGMPLNALLSAADAALYRAKANGRNRVEVADVPAAP